MIKGDTRYPFTEQLNAALREAYSAPTKREVSRRLKRVKGLRPEWPEWVWYHQVNRLGIGIENRRRRWSKAEDRLLLLHLGTDTVATLARRMGRSRMAVEQRARQLEVSYAVRDGFSQQSLARCFGVMPAKVAAWIRDGRLAQRDGRIPEASVARFVWENPDAYDLRRVDQVWFKSLLTVKVRQVRWPI